ncbi:uncharacterized protein LOC119318171 [Triticum dicoccoides]|uniref:uncharacterized protein LOC119318171 n=1 Tax=Triticum dicoccoides TaxID=85692 RepID=UPI001891520F|nr:uncharacterized protein LOC119318171 [Triticum dicoccoides]
MHRPAAALDASAASLSVAQPLPSSHRPTASTPTGSRTGAQPHLLTSNFTRRCSCRGLSGLALCRSNLLSSSVPTPLLLVPPIFPSPSDLSLIPCHIFSLVDPFLSAVLLWPSRSLVVLDGRVSSIKRELARPDADEPGEKSVNQVTQLSSRAIAPDPGIELTMQALSISEPAIVYIQAEQRLEEGQDADFNFLMKLASTRGPIRVLSV